MSIMGIIVGCLVVPIITVAVFSDSVNAAIIAGLFSMINTYLNIKLLRHLSATKAAARQGSDALLEIANIRAEDKPSSKREGD